MSGNLIWVYQNCRDEDSRTLEYRAVYDLETGECIVQGEDIGPWDLLHALGYSIDDQPMGRSGDKLLSNNLKLPKTLSGLLKRSKKVYGQSLFSKERTEKIKNLKHSV